MTATHDDFVVCRSIGHAWDEVPDDRQRTDPFHMVWTYRICLRCVRCTTKRYDGINAQGDVGQREYRYPDGYKYAVNETPSRSEFRIMMVKSRRRRTKARAQDAE